MDGVRCHCFVGLVVERICPGQWRSGLVVECRCWVLAGYIGADDEVEPVMRNSDDIAVDLERSCTTGVDVRR